VQSDYDYESDLEAVHMYVYGGELSPFIEERAGEVLRWGLGRIVARSRTSDSEVAGSSPTRTAFE